MSLPADPRADPAGYAAVVDLAARAGVPVPEAPSEPVPGSLEFLRARLRRGGEWLREGREPVEPLWGRGTDVLWATGESLVIAGPQGVGKTTIIGQLVKARLGICDSVLGLPVAMSDNPVLYLAMDRPRQAQRALGRLFTTGDELARADELLTVWPGPPYADVAMNENVFVRYAEAAGASTIFVDSIKDAAVGISKDEVGAGYNRARQYALAQGVEVVEGHHIRKPENGSAARSVSINNVYGSTWITSGAGSVIYLDGEPGDPIVAFHHVKQPAETVGPWRIKHDHIRGVSSVHEAVDLLHEVRRTMHNGLSVRAAAGRVYGTDKPSRAELQKVRRRLDAMAADGLLIRSGDGSESVYLAADTGPREWSPSAHAVDSDASGSAS